MMETASPLMRIYPSWYENSKTNPIKVTNMELKTFSKRKFRNSFLRILSLKVVSIYFRYQLSSKISNISSCILVIRIFCNISSDVILFSITSQKKFAIEHLFVHFTSLQTNYFTKRWRPTLQIFRLFGQRGKNQIVNNVGF